MASISDDPGGRRRILFMAPDGERRAFRLGKVPRRVASEVKQRVEAITAAVSSGVAIDGETARWLATIGDDLHAKLAAVELVGPRQPKQLLTVRDFLATWLADKKAKGYKVASLIAWGQTVTELTTIFGDKPLLSLTHTDGEAYRSAMQARGLRSATVHRRLGHGRQMFGDAVRLGHLSNNPWHHVRVRAGDPSERRASSPLRTWRESSTTARMSGGGCWWRWLGTQACAFHPKRSP